MPSRPAQHSLETLSRVRFREKIPPTWVVRDLDPDYGLDMLVDVFERDEATGLSFYVQIKGTRQEGAASHGVRLTEAQANLYRSVDLPVLVALFVAPVSTIYVRWFHAYDPHYEARTGEMRKTFTFHFRAVTLGQTQRLTT
jgi:hypothetical protein